MLELDRKSQIIMRDMRRHPEDARKGATKGLWFAGKHLQKELQEKIKDKNGKSGKYYTYKGRRVRASSAGEYPANRSGRLRKSVGFDVLNSEDMEFGYRDSVDYGSFLEKGTRNMSKRNGLGKTVEKNKTKIMNIVGREIEKEISRT